MSGHDGMPDAEAAAVVRVAHAELCFAAGGGRTVLVRQSVPYPFHITRTFQLDSARPDLATLYLQSASGGLYRGDDLAMAVAVRPGASVHVTTQAATVVHDTGALPARQQTTLDVADGAFLAYMPDPLVLFPGATLASETRVTLASRGRAIVVDAFAWHDPRGLARPFGTLTQTLEIVDPEGRRLVREHCTLHGVDADGANSPLGPFRASGTMLILGPPDAWPDGTALQQACDGARCLAGVSDLPRGVGRMLRCLACNGGDLRQGLAAIFPIAFRALTGIAPAPRRK